MANKQRDSIHLLRTDSRHADFIHLVGYLDDYLAEKDGEDHSFYDQYNKVDQIKYVVVAYKDKEAVGCGAIKEFDVKTMEVKRMYVSPESRGRGVAAQILTELEQWATELGFEKCLLETGKRQPEAIRLYEKSGYVRIPNYGPYLSISNSICFEKALPNNQSAHTSDDSQ